MSLMAQRMKEMMNLNSCQKKEKARVKNPARRVVAKM
jgi:hypothetical protein